MKSDEDWPVPPIEVKSGNRCRWHGWHGHTLLGAALAIAVLLSIDIGIRWAEAGTRLDRDCIGEAAVYTGSIRGDGVLAINPYDRECLDAPEPTYPGDSHPTPTKETP